MSQITIVLPNTYHIADYCSTNKIQQKNKEKIKNYLPNVTKLSYLTFKDDVAAVAQSQQFLLMQLHVHQLSILQYFMQQQLPNDDSSVSAAQHAKIRMPPSIEKILIVTHIITYQEQYYCLIPTNIIA